MTELNFCPYCDAASHKVVSLSNQWYFCKSCNKFFTNEIKQLECPKCQGKRYADSDFPSPDGQLIIQCQSCKKMFSLKEFLEKNNVKTA